MIWTNGLCSVLVVCLLAAAALMPLSASEFHVADTHGEAAMAEAHHNHETHAADSHGEDCASHCSSTCGQCSHCQAAPADRMIVDRTAVEDASEVLLGHGPVPVTSPFRPPISA